MRSCAEVQGAAGSDSGVEVKVMSLLLVEAIALLDFAREVMLGDGKNAVVVEEMAIDVANRVALSFAEVKNGVLWTKSICHCL